MRRVLIERNRYFDSVFLMRISRDLEQLPDVTQAIVAMGTPANVANLQSAGFAVDGSDPPILPADLVIAVEAASDDAIDEVHDHLRLLLTGPTSEERTTGAPRPMSIAEAIEVDPDVSLAIVSVPGEYAAREARQALRHGLHVMLFSDNVSVEDEIALKDEAVERGLLMMGPDCGTAILHGAPLGFANVVRRGSIGIVGASGTGLQEVSSLAHRFGGGISQAIGTGGRDLSGAVGARMTRFGIEVLASDPETEVLVVVSKAPATCVIPSIVGALEASGKPSIVHFVGFDPEKADPAWRGSSVRFATTLEESARMACSAAGVEIPTSGGSSTAVSGLFETAPAHAAARGYVRGLFCGGTLCQEAWALLNEAGLDVVSNVAFDPAKKARPNDSVSGHVLWDLGDDAFTVGRPHPMIEPALREDEGGRAAEDPGVGIVLVDCVLGYGAHADPAGSLADAARRAVGVREAGHELRIVASVTGTDDDPQQLSRQVAALVDADVLVAPSNAEAVRWVVEALKGGPK